MQDFSLRPSFAKYDFREEKPELHKDSDGQRTAELLRDVREKLADAEIQLQAGEARQALALLRRLYQRVSSRSEAAEDPSEAGAGLFLARALVRLHVGTLQGRLGQLTEALQEAHAAYLESDMVWRILLSVAPQVPATPPAPASHRGRTSPSHRGSRAADSPPALTGPPLAFKALLHRPPPWLALAVEASVRARRTLAQQLAAARTAQLLPEETAQDTEEEVARLVAEAAIFAGQLLPTGHPVRDDAEVALEEAEQRQHLADVHTASPRATGDGDHEEGEGVEKIEPLPSRPSQLPPLLAQGQQRRLQHSRSLPISVHASDPEGVPLPSRPPSVAAAIAAMSYRAPPPGDVFHASLPDRPRRSRAKHKRTSAAAAAPNPTLAHSSEELERPSDPFKDFLAGSRDMSKMSMRQLKLESPNGIQDSHEDLKNEGKYFKGRVLRSMDDDYLYDNRTLFCGYGVRTTRITERKKEKFRRSVLKQIEEAEQPVYGRYGLERFGLRPSIRTLGKLLEASGERAAASMEVEMPSRGPW